MTFTTFTSGINTSLSSELNDNFTSVKINRKVFDLATEFTTTSTTYTDVTNGSFTITAPVNSLIIGIYIRAELKISNSDRFTGCALKVTGSNLGTIYAPMMYSSVNAWTPSVTATSYTAYFNTNYGILKLLDGTTTFQFQTFSSSDGSRTAYIKNIHCEVIYVNVYNEV